MQSKNFKNVKLNSRFQKYALNKPCIDFEKIPSKFNQTTNLGSNSYSDVFIQDVPRHNTSGKRSGDLKAINPDAINSSLSKTIIKQMKRCHTENTKEENNHSQLKEYVKCLTGRCNQLNQKMAANSQKDDLLKEKERKQENRKFMLRHLSFLDIEEEKVEKQKTAMRRRKFTKRSASKIVGSRLSQNKGLDLQPKNNSETLMKMLKLIDKIYGVLEDMDRLGYITKLNKYMVSFCTGLKFWLSEVFLEESSGKKDNFSINPKYMVIGTSIEAKNSLTAHLIKQQKVDLNAKAHDMQELLHFMESVLSQKKINEISNIETYIESRLNYHKIDQNFTFDDLRLASYNSSDHFNFSEGIAQLEEKYGPMKEISKVSRSRFEDLNRALERLQSLV